MSRRPSHRSAKHRRASIAEVLERRTLLCGVISTIDGETRIDEGSLFVSYVDDEEASPSRSGPEGGATITWTNRGSATSDSDNFQNVFGANAANARNVIDQAIVNWTRVINAFNQTNGGNNINVTISMNTAGAGFASVANVTWNTSDNKPRSANITLGRGNDTDADGIGDGGGYFVDPTPFEHSEYLGSTANAYAAQAHATSPAANSNDLMSLIGHELGHAVGFIGGNPRIVARTTNTGVADTATGAMYNVTNAGNYYRWDGNDGSKVLWTAHDTAATGNNAGQAAHIAPGSWTDFGTFTTYRASRDLMNAYLASGWRTLVNPVHTAMLADAMAYDVGNPQDFGTFYNHRLASGRIYLRGQSALPGGGADLFAISRSGSFVSTSVSIGSPVLGAGPTGPFNVSYFIDGTTNVWMEGDSGNDTFIVNPVSLPVTIDGDIAFNTTSADDLAIINGASGVDTIAVNGNQITGSGHNITQMRNLQRLRFELDLGNDTVNVSALSIPTTINGSSGADTVVLGTGATDINTITAPVTFNGGNEDDTLNIGSGNGDAVVGVNVSFDGGSGTNKINFNDLSVIYDVEYDARPGSVIRDGLFFPYTVSYSNTSEIRLDGGSGNDLITIRNSVVPIVRAFGNGGNDTFIIGDGLLQGGTGHTMNGGSGTNNITFDDHLDNTGRTWQVNPDQVNFAGLFLSTIGFQAVTILGGNSGDSISFIAATYDRAYTVDGGAGGDSVTATNARIPSLTVRGGSGFNWLTVDDRNLTGTFIDQPNIYADQISRGFGPQLNVYYDDFSSVVYYLAALQNSVDVFGISSDIPSSSSFQIRGNTGNDDFNVFPRDAQGLSINGIVDFWGGGGQNVVTVWDSGSDPATFTVTSPNSSLTLLNGVGAGRVQVEADVQQLNVRAASGNDAFFVNELRSGIALALYGGNGNDTCTIGNGDMSLNLTSAAAFTFDGQGGSDRFTIANGATNLSWTYQVNNNSLVASKPSSGYSWNSVTQSIESQYVFAGSEGDSMSIDSTAQGLYTEFNGFGGADILQAGLAANTVNGIRGPISFNAGAGGGRVFLSNGSGLPATVHQDANTVGAYAGDNLFGTGGSLTFSGLTNIGPAEGLSMVLAPNSTVYAQPLASALVAISGGLIFHPASGSIKLALAGLTNPAVNGTSGSGSLTSSNRQTLSWSRFSGAIETDAVAPAVANMNFKLGVGARTIAPQSMRVTFTEAIGSAITPSFLSLLNTTTSTQVPAANIAVSYDAPTLTATFTFPGYSGGVLPNGTYQAQILAGLGDTFGNAMAASPVHTFIWAAGTSGNDTFRVARAGNFSDINVFLNNDVTPAYVAGPSTAQIVLAGDSGNDSLVVDMTNLNPTPAAGGIDFDGGDGTDSIKIKGSPNVDGVTFFSSYIAPGATYITHPNVETKIYDGGGGFDSLAVYGTTVLLPSSQRFGTLGIVQGGTVVMQPDISGLLIAQQLTIIESSTLDLTNNDLILDYTGASQLAAVQTLINSARAGGSWTGSGITSTSAKSANPKNTTLGAMEATDYKSVYGAGATFNGEPLDNTAVLVKYTYYGDADFNGVVNFDDYARIDAGFSQGRSGWLNGDFDGNGTVNFDDYSLIDLAFNTQGPVQRPGRTHSGRSR